MTIPGTRLYQLAGLDSPPSAQLVDGKVELDADEWDTMVGAAKAFLRGHGRVTPAWWSEQDPLESAETPPSERSRTAAASCGPRLAVPISAASSARIRSPASAMASLKGMLQSEADEAARSAMHGRFA